MRTLAALIVVVVSAVAIARAGAAADRPAPDDVNAIISAYMRDPNRHRAAMLALARRSDVELPPTVALMAADAALRSGAAQTAVRRFDRALASGLQDPWLGWTRLALGWIALTREDLPESRTQFGMAVQSPPSRPAAHLAIGLLDASERVSVAAEEFAAVVNDGAADPLLREAAGLGEAYARYWAGSHDEARMGFLAIAARNPDGPFADDARYAAALMAVHTGAWSDALAELTELSGLPPGARGREGTRRDLLNLEPRALVQAGIHRYRRGSLAPPDRQLAKLLDGDGVRLARAALTWVADLEERGAPPRDPLTRPWSPQPVSDAPIVGAAPRAPVARAEPVATMPVRPRAPTSWRGTAIVVLLVALVATLVLRVERRRRRW